MQHTLIFNPIFPVNVSAPKEVPVADVKVALEEAGIEATGSMVG